MVTAPREQAQVNTLLKLHAAPARAYQIAHANFKVSHELSRRDVTLFWVAVAKALWLRLSAAEQALLPRPNTPVER